MSRQVRNLTPQKWLMWKNSGWVPRAMVAKLPCFSRQLHHPEGQIFYGLIHTGYASVGMELDLISIDSQKKNWTVSIRFTHFWSVRLRPTLPNVDTAGCLKKKLGPSSPAMAGCSPGRPSRPSSGRRSWRETKSNHFGSIVDHFHKKTFKHLNPFLDL